MRVLLIEPPMQSIMLARADWFPMSLAYLAGAAKNEGHDVLIYNGEHDPALDYINLSTYSSNYHHYTDALKDPSHQAWKKISDIIKKYKPDIVGITSHSVKFPSAGNVAALVKDYRPDVPVVMGGPHATIMTDQVLGDPHIDFVIRGEGERTFVDFLHQSDTLRKWNRVKGLSYKNGKIIHNPPRELVASLDELPYPARECLYDIENYEANTLSKLFTSRGCPFKCGYCGTQNVWTNRSRHHGVQRIISEIKLVKEKYGATYFSFMDDVFGLNKQHTLDLLAEMKKENLNIKWDCLTRAKVINDELLGHMKEAGCSKIDIGVESGSERVLRDTQKGITLNEIEDAAALIKKHGIFLYCFLMIGLPTETEEDIELTRKFLLKIRPDWAGISIFTPIPGTRIYEELREEGKIPRDPDFAKFSHQSPHNNFAFNLKNRDSFPVLANDMIEFVQKYNGSFRHLLKRALTRGYHRNPKLILFDLKKVSTWMK